MSTEPTNTVNDTKVRELVARAEAAQKEFEQAPNLYIAEQRTDLLTEVAKKHLPDAYGLRPKKHAFWCKHVELASYANRGYVPVIVNGDMVHLNELVLTWIPHKMHVLRERAYQAESRARTSKEMKKAAVANDKIVGGDAVDTRGLTVEKATIENRTITPPDKGGEEDGG